MREEASLINWLSRLAERQIIAAADYHGAKKRDNRRNVTLSGAIGDTQSPSAPLTLPRPPRPASARRHCQPGGAEDRRGLPRAAA
jgi:hypothetical protein